MTSFIGVDVGTTSARAGVFTADGRLVAQAKEPIALYLEAGEIAEHASDDIWRAVCTAVRAAVADAGSAAGNVRGIGFDATCSLVVLDRGGRPLPVGDSGRPDRDVIVWMDHRAVAEARDINATRHPVLDYVGGAISPEMQTPKLLWLRKNRPETFAAAGYFFDLVDYLTWRASGSTVRSVCTLTCKWTYLAHEHRWDPSYFRTIGLSELVDEGFVRIGTETARPGTALGRGLTDFAARDLGLQSRTPVAAGLIDAHAGGIATVGASGDGTIASRMGYIFGTSACTMVATTAPVRVGGVWGPYYDAMMPGLWLNEGGQSAAGAALDHLVKLHPAAATLATGPEGIVGHLAKLASERAPTHSDVVRLVGGVHVVPEFLGNRAPFADPDARAVIAGLDLDESIDSLVALYVAGLCGLGYGTRQIAATCAAGGIRLDTIVISGGAGRSDLVRQVIADSTGLAVATVATEEPVLLGAAMLGAVAGGSYADLNEAMPAMSRLDRIYRPAGGEIARLHARRFAAYEALQAAARAVRVAAHA